VIVSSAIPAVDKIKIGEISSYSAIPSFTEPYRKGWQLALDEINAANELVASDGVVMLAGTFFSNIGLAVSDYAKQKKILFLAAEPLTEAITLSKVNRYTFRLRPVTYEQAAMLTDEAAKLPTKKWATIAPNYEYGQSAVAAFKKLLSAKATRDCVGR
jgi:branched-chain amino acid transport system substrate-binding protein